MVASSEVVYEKRLYGLEFSLHAFCDANTTLFMPVSKDYKKKDEYDHGPNTGGMGSISNFNILDIIDPKFHESITKQLESLKEKLAIMVKDISYSGILYTGCIIHDILNNPQIKVLEFNCRFGDPETQSIIQHYTPSMLTNILKKMTSNELDQISNIVNNINDKNMYLSVVLSHNLYPKSKSFEKININLKGIVNIISNHYNNESLCKIFTSLKQNNSYFSNDKSFYSYGGRIFTLTFKAGKILRFI